ncbi:uncharacterized protein AMSG_10227 [Thecamonas trahens ATCC 50062]|uniref:Uncharacterized protein n=1 Tax=Thecamonas trahens ATCC 50062 TaxID=461836 RepID=A0A0L0DSG9_THETB|nr:hypothetical protein AMSG_10227 [Thecamonas trahens ATCC 50062]KNC54981.1 hypothetical protein AMSG_10227 [Thecamonas trahens ATCC 50062]|eukprot:XP_013753427.1 hypothetical protein AMSG_10227 [Thecamonas trahens ATCC 50062]
MSVFQARLVTPLARTQLPQAFVDEATGIVPLKDAAIGAVLEVLDSGAMPLPGWWRVRNPVTGSVGLVLYSNCALLHIPLSVISREPSPQGRSDSAPPSAGISPSHKLGLPSTGGSLLELSPTSGRDVAARNAVSVMMQSAPLLPPPPAPRSRANHARANHARSISANPSIVGIGVPRAVVRQTSLVSLIEFDSGALEREGSQSDCGPRGSELSDASDVGDGYDDDDDDGLASSDHARHRQVFSQDEATLDRALGDLRIEDNESGSGLRSMRRSVSSTSVLMHRPPEPATSGYPRFRAKELIGGPPSASVDNSDEMTELRDVYIEVGRKSLKVYVKGALSFVPDQEIMVYSHKYGHIDQFHVLEQRQRFQYSIGSDASAVAALPITHSASWALGGSEAGGETGTDKQVPSPTAAAAREVFVFSTPQAVELHNAILDQIAKLMNRIK